MNLSHAMIMFARERFANLMPAQNVARFLARNLGRDTCIAATSAIQAFVEKNEQATKAWTGGVADWMTWCR